MAKVTGIGGVFFKTSDPKALAAWYSDHLGMNLEDWGGVVLKWPEDPADDGGLTVWHVAAQDSAWFPGPMMVNYRVDDLDGLLDQLRAAGVEIVGGPDAEFNGRFAWILDPDGRKVELWEPSAPGDP
jgi:catechol 2,3-dioxygenase-like lactoylglutathione lyase family enzyme